MRFHYFATLLSLIFLFASKSSAQTIQQDTIPLKYGAHRTGNRTDANMERWRSYGLGQFIHWGIYAIPGGNWEGKTYNGAAEWIRSWGGNAAPENWTNTYDNLYKQFNPTDFDAKNWAKQAKAMGAKYVIFTTKHHDGFCMWPSKYTNYTVKNTPYKKDIVKQIVDAYDAEGIDVYLYFSIIDWNQPGYTSGLGKPNPMTKESWASFQPFSSDEQKNKYEDFKKFTRNQLIELLKNYPKTKGLWFDGTWDTAWMKEAEFTDNLEKELRALRSGLIIGSRFRADDFGKRHFDSNGKMMGDYEQGWERKLPSNMDVLNGRDWDCVMTIPPNQWGYNSDWKSSYIKTSYDLADMLMHAVSMNGNLVINFGPDGKGNMRPEENLIAEQLGDWMKVNSEAVYETKYAGLPKPDYGYYSQKEDKLYLTVFNRPVNNLIRIEIPAGFKKTIKSAKVLGSAQILKVIKTNIGLDQDKTSYFDIVLPENYLSIKPFVLEMELDNNVRANGSYGDAKT